MQPRFLVYDQNIPYVCLRPDRRLQIIRAARDMTLVRVAKTTGIQLAKLSHIENDHVTASPEEKKKISKALDVPVVVLFPEEGARS